ncbi:MAG: beta-ketoacyl synthase chain length factor [Bacteroidales bacterium]|jgi:3-oxoacyl-(acyl-carrier-protein) synthase|nr:beta-ketoacyl synthase chain length factor [Bacteroidales bacterium]
MVYIQSIAHISIQEPFEEKWFESPLIYKERYVRSIEPDFSEFIAPMAARRMGKILKRALATSLKTIKDTSIEKPDAIITGTGLGCIENTEKFLTAMLDNNEELLPPTYFMQSTHNTISSQIAVYLKCHSYNSTYSHRGTSFDSALLDAFIQFQLGEISSALVSGHDELTPGYFALLDKIGYWKKGEISEEILRDSQTPGALAGEASVSFMLDKNKTKNSFCEIKGIEMLYKPDKVQFKKTLASLLQSNGLNEKDIDAVIVGISGDVNNDSVYKNMHSEFFPDKPLLWYKHIFGESYSASGLGLYTAATILKNKKIPQHIVYCNNVKNINPKNILVYNHFQNKDHSLILLSSC